MAKQSLASKDRLVSELRDECCSQGFEEAVQRSGHTLEGTDRSVSASRL